VVKRRYVLKYVVTTSDRILIGPSTPKQPRR
jgi:hypothetical protein